MILLSAWCRNAWKLLANKCSAIDWHIGWSGTRLTRRLCGVIKNKTDLSCLLLVLFRSEKAFWKLRTSDGSSVKFWICKHKKWDEAASTVLKQSDLTIKLPCQSYCIDSFDCLKVINCHMPLEHRVLADNLWQISDHIAQSWQYTDMRGIQAWLPMNETTLPQRNCQRWLNKNAKFWFISCPLRSPQIRSFNFGDSARRGCPPAVSFEALARNKADLFWFQLLQWRFQLGAEAIGGWRSAIDWHIGWSGTRLTRRLCGVIKNKTDLSCLLLVLFRSEKAFWKLRTSDGSSVKFWICKHKKWDEAASTVLKQSDLTIKLPCQSYCIDSFDCLKVINCHMPLEHRVLADNLWQISDHIAQSWQYTDMRGIQAWLPMNETTLPQRNCQRWLNKNAKFWFISCPLRSPQIRSFNFGDSFDSPELGLSVGRKSTKSTSMLHTLSLVTFTGRFVSILLILLGESVF